MFVAGIEIFFGFVAGAVILGAALWLLYALTCVPGWLGRHLPKYEPPT
jgi:hypothetical protein